MRVLAVFERFPVVAVMVAFIAGIPELRVRLIFLDVSPMSVRCVTFNACGQVGTAANWVTEDAGCWSCRRESLIVLYRRNYVVSKFKTITDSRFDFACVDPPFVQQVVSFHRFLHHHRSRSQLAVGRSGGSQCCSGRVDEFTLEQAAGGLVEQDVGVVIQPRKKLIHQVSSFVLGSAREPELGRMSVDGASCRGKQARECSPRRWRWATPRAPYVWPELQARWC